MMHAATWLCRMTAKALANDLARRRRCHHDILALSKNDITANIRRDDARRLKPILLPSACQYHEMYYALGGITK